MIIHKDTIQSRLWNGSAPLIVRTFCGMAMMMLLTARVWAQSSQDPTQLSSPPDASVLAERTISALGGQEAWSQVKSVESLATITSNRRSAKSVKWTDDWSSGALHASRTQNTLSAGKAQYEATPRVRSMEGGQILSAATELSFLVPARALILATHDAKCTFYQENDDRMGRFSTHDIPSGQWGFVESCSGSPLGKRALHWRISATTYLPVSVYVPLSGVGLPSVSYVTIVYHTFIQLGSLKLPEQVEIIPNWNERKQIKFTDITLVRAN